MVDVRKPYSGLSRSLVIAIDVGTTFSGVRISSVLFLTYNRQRCIGFVRHSRTRRNTKNPWCYSVSVVDLKIRQAPIVFCRFPGQEHVAGNSKIPSIIYYDKYGTVKAAGAEVDNTSVVAQAEDEGWIKAELYDFISFQPI